MSKIVELSFTACRWFTQHDFYSEEEVKDAVKFTPLKNREKNKEKNCFFIEIKKKKNHSFVEIKINYIEEENRYFIINLHSKGI